VEKYKIFEGFKTVQLSDLTLLGSPVHSGPAVVLVFVRLIFGFGIEM